MKVLAERFADDEAPAPLHARGAAPPRGSRATPNIVTIFDVGEHEGRPYIVMEYIAGGSLADRLGASGAQPPDARAAGSSRRRGGARRGARPAASSTATSSRPTSCSTRTGDVHVADFGVASAAGLDSLTATGTVLGTAGYLAPEQARGERATPAERPLRARRRRLRAADRVAALSRRVADRGGGRARQRARSRRLGRGTRAAAGARRRLRRALAKDPDGRFAIGAELVAALRAALDRGGRPHDGSRRAPIAPPSSRPVRAAKAQAQPAAGRCSPDWQRSRPHRRRARRRGDHGRRRARGARRGRMTVRETVTAQGTTVVKTVTTAPEPHRRRPPPPTTSPPPSGNPVALNDEGFELMQSGDYEAALPLLEQAVAALDGTGALDRGLRELQPRLHPLRARAAATASSSCSRSEQVQGDRKEIDRLRKEHREGL